MKLNFKTVLAAIALAAMLMTTACNDTNPRVGLGFENRVDKHLSLYITSFGGRSVPFVKLRKGERKKPKSYYADSISKATIKVTDVYGNPVGSPKFQIPELRAGVGYTLVVEAKGEGFCVHFPQQDCLKPAAR